MDNDQFKMCVELQPTPDNMAILVTDGSVEAWILLSQIKYDGDLRDKIEMCQAENKAIDITISIPVWLAKKKGFV